MCDARKSSSCKGAVTIQAAASHLVMMGPSTASMVSPMFSISTEWPASMARSMMVIMLSAPMRTTCSTHSELTSALSVAATAGKGIMLSHTPDQTTALRTCRLFLLSRSLIHSTPCNCGSIISGQRSLLVRIMPFCMLVGSEGSPCRTQPAIAALSTSSDKGSARQQQA